MLMSEKHDALLAELDEKYEQIKADLGLKVSLDEIDRIFGIRDLVLANGFVSTSLSWFITLRMRDAFESWSSSIHRWLKPVPGSIPSALETESLDEHDKDELYKIMMMFLSHITEYNFIFFLRDPKLEKRYIENSVRLWHDTSDFLMGIITKFKQTYDSEINKINNSFKDHHKKHSEYIN